jgi:hypothetical protein
MRRIPSSPFVTALVLALGCVFPSSGSAVGDPGDPALVSWYEQAYAYYSAVMAGQETHPDSATWSAFLEQMEWARQQLGGGSGWDHQSGVLKTDGRIEHQKESIKLAFLGSSGIHELWSKAVTIDVPSVSACVKAEFVNDAGSRSTDSLLRITIADPALDSTTVYLVHRSKDSAVAINLPSGSLCRVRPALVRWGVFQRVKPGAPPGR